MANCIARSPEMPSLTIKATSPQSVVAKVWCRSHAERVCSDEDDNFNPSPQFPNVLRGSQIGPTSSSYCDDRIVGAPKFRERWPVRPRRTRSDKASPRLICKPCLQVLARLIHSIAFDFGCSARSLPLGGSSHGGANGKSCSSKACPQMIESVHKSSQSIVRCCGAPPRLEYVQNNAFPLPGRYPLQYR